MSTLQSLQFGKWVKWDLDVCIFVFVCVCVCVSGEPQRQGVTDGASLRMWQNADVSTS